MKTKGTFDYTDWGNFVQVDKREWNKLQKWLKAHGITMQKLPTKKKLKTCLGKTRLGRTCTRAAQPGRDYCHYH